jgi:hypothetical protein
VGQGRALPVGQRHALPSSAVKKPEHLAAILHSTTASLQA